MTLYVNLDKMSEDELGNDDLRKAIDKFTGLMLAGEKYVTLEYIAPGVSLSELTVKEGTDGQRADTG